MPEPHADSTRPERKFSPPRGRGRRAQALIGALGALALAGPPLAAAGPADRAPAAHLTDEQIGRLRALIADPDAPIDCDHLITLVIDGRLGGGRADREAIGAALAGCCDRRSVGILFERMRSDAIADVERRAIEGALIEALALGSPPDDWGAWWSRWRTASQEAWDRAIIERLGERERALDGELREAEAQLLEAYRRVLSLTPEPDRPAAIATMVRSPSPRVARVGLELALQTLLNAGDITGDVVAAAKVHMTGPDDRLRYNALRLLEQVAPEVVAERALEALADECDPAVAGIMLRAVARSGGVRLGERLAAGWVEQGAEALASGDKGLFNAACQAGARAVSVPPGDPEARTRMGRALAQVSDADLTDAGAGLVAALGDRERAIRLLRSGSEGGALGAARALIGDEPALSDVVRAAKERPGLRSVALEAIRAARADAPAFDTVLDLFGTRDLDAFAVASIGSFAASLSLEELAGAVGRVQSPEVRAAALAPLAGPGGAEGPPDPRMGELLLTLGEAQLALDRPGPAIEAGERAVVQGKGPTARRAELLTRATLRTGDVAAAEAVAATAPVRARVWLDCARIMQGEALARAIEAIGRVYPDQLTEAEAAELAALEATVRAGPGVEGEPEPAPES